ncbi:hypothetical protein Tco_0375235 [Tanacetum coccineum]
MSMWIISRGVVLLILLMLSISFKFGISGLLQHVVTAIADRIRGCLSHNLQVLRWKFIKDLDYTVFLILALISSTWSLMSRGKPKRVKDYAYHKEKMMMCKQAEQGVPLQAEQADWLEDTDEEIDEQELEAHYSYMAKIQEVSPEETSSSSQPLEQVQNHDENDVFANVRRHSEQPESINDTYVLEKDDSNIIPDSIIYMCNSHIVLVDHSLSAVQVKDKVVPKTIVKEMFQRRTKEDHHRISSISKKTKSVTACNDSSNSRTSNENAVCAECGTCVFNSNHDACVSRYLKDVNARTKKPNVVPIVHGNSLKQDIHAYFKGRKVRTSNSTLELLNRTALSKDGKPTLVEAARTMFQLLIFHYIWAEAVATRMLYQNRFQSSYWNTWERRLEGISCLQQEKTRLIVESFHIRACSSRKNGVQIMDTLTPCPKKNVVPTAEMDRIVT